MRRAPAVGAPRTASGSTPRARGMRAADSGTWERVRQLAAQGEPAPSCGAGAGPARPPGPAACERCADAAGPGGRPRGGAPFVREDGDRSQPGMCEPGGAAVRPQAWGAAGAGRAGALPPGTRAPLVAKFSPCAEPGARGAVQGEPRGTRSLFLGVGAGISGLRGFPAAHPREGCRGRSRPRLLGLEGPAAPGDPAPGRTPRLLWGA